jgi:hypothetical protein
LIVLAVALVAVQFVPVDRTNPPIDATLSLNAPAPVIAIVERACFNCHSQATVWPWYAYVAPMSWLVERDVTEGREEMNLSEWGSWSESRRAYMASEIVEMTESEEMPPWFYKPFHADSKLSEEDLKVLKDWAESVSGAG